MPAATLRDVNIPTDGPFLEGILTIPAGAHGVVAFAHGSGSGRHSPRNRFVAEVLNEKGLATLLLDLLTEEEAEDRARVFDIDLLASRLGAAVVWLAECVDTRALSQGLFGASTGAAAALKAAARQGDRIKAVVSRGGRPDLAGEALAHVTAPTLLLVGSLDTPVLRLNEMALARLRCPKELIVVPGATHLFSEPGTLEEVSRHAAEWFARHLGQ